MAVTKMILVRLKRPVKLPTTLAEAIFQGGIEKVAAFEEDDPICLICCGRGVVKGTDIGLPDPLPHPCHHCQGTGKEPLREEMPF